jgi:Ca-activated chloride channel homolog
MLAGSLRTIGLLMGLMLVSSLILQAQAQVQIRPRKKKPVPGEQLPGSTLRIRTNLVLVPVTVNDPRSRPVSALEKENFRVFEDGVEQTITQFAMEDEPTAVGLVFDTSGSMGAKLGTSRVAARQFFKTANPEDEFFLVQFDSSPKLLVRLTADTGTIESQLLFSRSKGSTALLDAVYLSLHEIKRSNKNKKALLVISDGGDNHSRYSFSEVRRTLRESDVLIYSIGVFGGAGTAEEMGGPGLLSQIASDTGGQAFVANAGELPDIAEKIGIDLRNRYVLAYSPKDQERDGRYRRIRVQVIPPRGLPKLHAHWRLGYYAPVD